MTRRVFVYLLCLVALCVPVAVYAGGSPDARVLMQQNFMASKVTGFKGRVSMVLIAGDGQKRVRKLAMWSKLKGTSTESQVLMRFEEPRDIQGTSFLQIEHSAADDDIWVYLPALGKVRRLVASNKRDSFFGTDFSYGDVLLPAVNKNGHTYLRSETLDGVQCDVVESRPKQTKIRDDSGYSRKVQWLDGATRLERKVEYYDLAGKLLKTQRAYDIKQVETSPKRWMPMRREMVNHQTHHRTVYNFEKLELDSNLDDSLFTTRSPERL